MRTCSLASGSGGNAYLVAGGDQLLLIDCGISCRDLKKRMASVGFDFAQIAAVLVTHSHIDHVRGLGTLHKALPDVPVFANFMTAEASAAKAELDEEAFVCFENGQPFEVGPFRVSAFSIPHDTSDPVGYLVKAEGLTYFHGTDIGTPLDSVGVHLAEADVATLESNHDPVLLKTSPRPESLKQRISGPRGHLSNDECCDLVRRFASPRLKRLALAHLSRECNAPHLAENAMVATLKAMGREDIDLEVLSQDVPSRVWEGRG